MNTYIGIDLGGTNVRVALVDEKGNVLQSFIESTQIEQGAEHVILKMFRMVESLDNYISSCGIGLGVPGPVDTIKGRMVMATNLPGFEDFPIVERFKEKFNMPIFVDNDVNVAVMGEAMLGAGKDVNSMYFVTISTGIGGGFIVNKKIISGAHGHAGEIGNIIVDRFRNKVNTLNVGAIENEASGSAIVKKGKLAFPDKTINHAGDVFDLARANKPKAIAICDEMALDLAITFSIIAHVCDPDIFILNGGVMKGKDVFFDKMEKYFRERIHVGMQPIRFVDAQLKEPGIIGAAMLVKAYIGV